jgi:hypothetical protein
MVEHSLTKNKEYLDLLNFASHETTYDPLPPLRSDLYSKRLTTIDWLSTIDQAVRGDDAGEEVFFTAIWILDRALSRVSLERDVYPATDIVFIGLCSYIISYKYHVIEDFGDSDEATSDIDQNNYISKWCYIVGGGFTTSEIERGLIMVLKDAGWIIPTITTIEIAMTFLPELIMESGDPDLIRYIALISLADYSLNSVRRSTLAVACIVLSYRLKGVELKDIPEEIEITVEKVRETYSKIQSDPSVFTQIKSTY